MVSLPNGDSEEVDFNDINLKWKYLQFICDNCEKDFNTKRMLNNHINKEHKQVSESTAHTSVENKSVDFEEVNCVIEEYTQETHTERMKTAKSNQSVSQQKMRFKETTEERPHNDEWINTNNKLNEEEIYVAEIKENKENFHLFEEAKEKEVENFEKFKVFEEVPDVGQEVIGTRFVLTEKEDGSIKARLVIKGFQEDYHQSDSPTVSRDSLKVFCSVAANQQWDIEGSDVSAAFLQSEKLDRNVFIKPPPQRKKSGYIWKLLKPAYGLTDASRKWFQSVVKTLKTLDMKTSFRDSCLFYYRKSS